MAISTPLLLSTCSIGAIVLCACAQPGLPQLQENGKHRTATVESNLQARNRLGGERRYDSALPPPYTPKGELEETLHDLQQRRDELLLKYTAVHPDVRLLDTQIRVLRQQIEMAHN